MTKAQRKFSQRTCVRMTVAHSQKWQCNLCHTLLPARFELDHIIPLHLSGNDTFENLQALCAFCHNKKTHQEQLNRILKQTPQLPPPIRSRYFEHFEQKLPRPRGLARFVY